MPKMVSELAQGNQFSRSSDGGQLADTATRVFKIILNSPSESIDIMSAVGVQIGDPYSASNPIPCVSVEGRADGESRLVRIVTAQYRTSAMVDGEGGTGLPDPMLVMPDVRPANFSTSTSLYEMPAVSWAWPGGEFEPVRNPVGDPVDGVTKLEPITTIRVTQFSYLPGTIFHQYVGYINDADMSLGTYATFKKHTVMFRGVEATPHVETHGIVTYRGFMNSYEFAYRRNFVKNIIYTPDSDFGADISVGWDSAVIVEGFNCIAFDPASPANDEDRFGQPLAIDPSTETIKEPFALPEKINAGDRVRAMVKIVNPTTGKAMQNSSAMPIALNKNGRPRKLSATNKPLIWQKQVQPEGDLVSLLQLRLS